jgi:hypothetical protein
MEKKIIFAPTGGPSSPQQVAILSCGGPSKDINFRNVGQSSTQNPLFCQQTGKTVQENTRWFKYDRDYLCVNKSQFVPVIFEPPCTNINCTSDLSMKLVSVRNRKQLKNFWKGICDKSVSYLDRWNNKMLKYGKFNLKICAHRLVLLPS